MVKKKKKVDREINPNSFYKKTNGIYDLPKKMSVLTKRNVEDIKKRNEIKGEIEQEKKSIEQIPIQFDQKKYKKTANKKLEDIGANVRVYNKPSHDTIMIILIGIIIIFGLFFVWSVSNNKFKTDYNCPSCNCPQAQISCPEINLSTIKQSVCICNQTCPAYNNSAVVDAIRNISNCKNCTGG